MKRSRIERIAREAGRHGRSDREIHPALEQRFLGAAEHGLVELDAGLGLLGAKLREAFEQAARWET